ncbi:hypothetical protein TWF730_008323 [Orbilia blumenaviensis]|uniref:Uncharacterized protein n=1 Tax=Orbilia blumenaviensis TaxID=1796055 RepID=A0AAV9V252_9PEZI
MAPTRSETAVEDRLDIVESQPLLPLYTVSTALPPAYKAHRSDRLLLTSNTSPSHVGSEEMLETTQELEEMEEEEEDPTKRPLFSITAHLRLKIHSPLQLLHRFLFCFLILNTALFALLAYNLDETSIVTLAGAEDAMCPCPLPINELIPGGCYGFLNGEVGMLSRREYGKLEIWKQCIVEFGKLGEWREWVLWVVMPGMCIVEMVAAWGWWWCLREEEKVEEEVRLLEEEEEREREAIVEKRSRGEV